MAVLPLVGRERELGTLDDLVDCVGERGGRWWCATRLGSEVGPAEAVRTGSRAKVV
jgi:hypothetical protein